ncbi:MAG: protein kinase, partial [Acidimicrobiales bacterium]|nr:protein kinase [Acidimicrobiales bacterium]
SVEASDGSLDLTGTGQLLGTPAYLPPERLDGGPATAQSDLYSLGVVLYEALTGQCPFPGETPVAAAMAIVAGEYPSLDEVRPGLDPVLVTTIQRAMATDPAQRFESAPAMATALTVRDPTVAMVDDLTLVHAAAPGTAIIDHPVMRETTEVPLAPPPPAGRRPARVPLAAALVALALVALLVAALNRDGGGPNQPATAQTETTQPAPTTVAQSQAPQTTVATVAPSRPAPVAPAPAAGSGRNDDKGKGNGKGKD